MYITPSGQAQTPQGGLLQERDDAMLIRSGAADPGLIMPADIVPRVLARMQDQLRALGLLHAPYRAGVIDAPTAAAIQLSMSRRIGEEHSTAEALWRLNGFPVPAVPLVESHRIPAAVPMFVEFVYATAFEADPERMSSLLKRRSQSSVFAYIDRMTGGGSGFGLFRRIG